MVAGRDVRRRRHSIAGRLALWFLLLSVLPIAVMVVFVRHSVNDAFGQLAARDARAEAGLMALALEEAPPARRETLLSALEREGRSVAVLDPSGRAVEARGLPDAVAAAVDAGGPGEAVDMETGRLYGWAPMPGGGAVVVVRGAEVVDAPILRMERASFVQITVSLLIVAAAGAIAIWMVIGPIQSLTDAAEAIGRGDLSVVIDPEDMEGELRVLAASFNQMAERLRESYTLLEQQVADRTRELATLNRVSSAVGRSMNVETMLEAALSTVLEQLGYHGGAIGLVDHETGSIRLGRCEGFPAELCVMAPWDGPVRRVVATGAALVHAEGAGASGVTATVADAYRLVVMLPMTAKGQVEGVLIVADRDRQVVSAPERELLVSVGHQIGVGLQNARLHEQAMQVAVLEERQRLSRELHDSVTQSLYGVTLYGEAASRLLASGDTEQGTDYMRQACQTAQAALQEMRLLIFELRPSVLEEVGLVGALRARLEQVEGRAGVQAEHDLDAGIELPPHAEEALYRIAQEALNNALKHARARHVRVSLARRDADGTLVLEIADDGAGMDVERARGQGGMGLRTMAERVEQLGGTLSVSSAPGEGTVVRVEVPAPDAA